MEQAFSEYDAFIAINVAIPYLDSNGIASLSSHKAEEMIASIRGHTVLEGKRERDPPTGRHSVTCGSGYPAWS